MQTISYNTSEGHMNLVIDSKGAEYREVAVMKDGDILMFISLIDLYDAAVNEMARSVSTKPGYVRRVKEAIATIVSR